MLDATGKFGEPLTEDRLFAWHAALFPTGRSGHYTAPPAERIAQEMGVFLDWFNQPPTADPVVKAARAHLWFVTIHPFDDGNGRIARAIADMALARSEGSPQRFYSMSAQIETERNAYYNILERTQKGHLDVTNWMIWFLGCLHRAIDGAQGVLSSVTFKAKFWERAATVSLNDRQIKVLNRMLDGFEGKMTSSKWAKIGKCSQDSANRDIAALIEHGLLEKGPGGGRSTHYVIVSEVELLKGAIKEAYDAPDSSYSALSISDVIARNAR